VPAHGDHLLGAQLRRGQYTAQPYGAVAGRGYRRARLDPAETVAFVITDVLAVPGPKEPALLPT
jgi:hypothetical protein